jgi:hypothetical protein
MSYLQYNQGVNYTLYYNALDYFETIMTNHPSIAKVTTGGIEEVDAREFPMYPLGNINILSSTISNSTTRHEIQLVVADKIKNKDNESNPITNEQTIPFYGVDDMVDILANTLAIINDLTSYTQYSVAAFDIDGDIVCEPFMDRFNNGLAGHVATFTLVTHNDRPRCLWDLLPSGSYPTPCPPTPTCTYTVGQLTQGGIVAYASPSGAIVLALEDIGSGIIGCEGLYYEGADIVSSSNQISADTIGMGWYNTQNILTQCTSSTAATLASNYSGSGYTDWCLGNRGEWQQIYNNRVTLNYNGANLDLTGSTLYWESVPFGPFVGLQNNYASAANMTNGNMTDTERRTNINVVRPIRYLCDLTPNTSGSI